MKKKKRKRKKKISTRISKPQSKRTVRIYLKDEELVKGKGEKKTVEVLKQVKKKTQRCNKVKKGEKMNDVMYQKLVHVATNQFEEKMWARAKKKKK